MDSEKLMCGRSGCVCSKGKLVHCPVPDHPDVHPSLSINEDDGRVLVKCHSRCSQDEVLDALKTLGLWGGGASTPPDSNALVHSDLTLEDYAEYKHLPVDFLKGLGLSTITYNGSKAVRIPYHSPSGGVLATQYRIANDGPEKHRWKSGDKPNLYGLDRLSNYKDKVVLVEGASDAQTLMYHNIPVIGLPSASGWKEERDAEKFKDVDRIYVVIEPDSGGDAVKKWLQRSSIRHKVDLVYLVDGFKDPSEMWIADPDKFRSRWEVSINNAVPWLDFAIADNEQERAESLACCERIAVMPNILEEFIRLINKMNLVGEDTNAKIVYLEMISRFLAKPVNLIIKGTSSGGKSIIPMKTSKLFREGIDFHFFTAFSDKSIINYDKEFSHTIIIIAEWQGMASDMVSYLIRTLMSEGRVKFLTSVKDEDGNWVTKEIVKEGPTGVIVTTTATKIHWENETRHLSLLIDDTPEQTSRVLNAISREMNQLDGSDEVYAKEIEEFQQLQRWLTASNHRVFIPYADQLANLIPTVAVRLRRDYSGILTLIQANAILHQATRQTDDSGRIIATLQDYQIVKDLIDNVISEGVARTVKPVTRETVDMVEKLLLEPDKDHVTNKDLVNAFGLDQSAVYRRVSSAVADGYLENIASKGKPYRLIAGSAMPEDQSFMPEADQLCMNASDSVLVETPPPPISSNHLKERDLMRAVILWGGNDRSRWEQLLKIPKSSKDVLLKPDKALLMSWIGRKISILYKDVSKADISFNLRAIAKFEEDVPGAFARDEEMRKKFADRIGVTA